MAAVRKEAEARVPSALLVHWNIGNEDNQSLDANTDAWSRLRLMPRVCVDVRHPELATTVLGRAVSSPIFVAPFATGTNFRPICLCCTHRPNPHLICRCSRRRSSVWGAFDRAKLRLEESSVRVPPLLLLATTRRGQRLPEQMHDRGGLSIQGPNDAHPI